MAGTKSRHIVLKMIRGKVDGVAELTVKRGSEGEKDEGGVIEVKRVEIR